MVEINTPDCSTNFVTLFTTRLLLLMILQTIIMVSCIVMGLMSFAVQPTPTTPLIAMLCYINKHFPFTSVI